jgi:hypothetical protein
MARLNRAYTVPAGSMAPGPYASSRNIVLNPLGAILSRDHEVPTPMPEPRR